MKVLLSWLREFAPFEASVESLASDLAELGLSVDEVSVLGGNFSGVVVAKVKELKPHPDADRIQLVEVETTSNATVQVCCGAFNMEVGDFVPLANVGAILPNGMEIGRRKMRGEWSEGMLCSGEELGLGADTNNAGIMILPDNLNLGEDLITALELKKDTLFDLEVNPNRPDAMSVMGVARDLAAKQGLPFEIPEPQFVESGTSAAELVQTQIDAPDLCGHFHTRILNDVQIKPSSSQIANRLLACGMRPLNNIVDISNYVMLEMGQPTHSFDLDTLKDGYLKIRMADDGETLQTLDGEKRQLMSTDGVITNAANEAISIAGVMGGATTEISDSTKRVVMEAAWWKPINIARTSRRMGLRSEASARFERGVDTELAELALNRIAQLAGESGAKIAPGITGAKGNLPAAPKIALRLEQIKRQLGVEIDAKASTKLLESIGFQVKKPDLKTPSLEVQTPTYRLDISGEIDLIEEIARTYGYNHIPRNVPRPISSGSLTERQRRRRDIVDILRGFGFAESISLPFLAPGDLETVGLQANCVVIQNPAIEEESVLRASLRPGILKSVTYNIAHQNHGVKLFEVGKVFEKDTKDSELPKEQESLAIALAGEDAFLLGGYIRGLLDAIGLEHSFQNHKNLSGLHPVRGAKVLAKTTKTTKDNQGLQEIGVFGEVDPAICSKLKITESLVMAELNLDLLLDLRNDSFTYQAPSKYPSSNFDLAFWVDDAISSEAVLRTLIKTAQASLKTGSASTQGSLEESSVEVKLFDVFRQDQVSDKRSLAFNLRLQAPDRTLTDKEVTETIGLCLQAVIDMGGEPRALPSAFLKNP